MQQPPFPQSFAGAVLTVATPWKRQKVHQLAWEQISPRSVLTVMSQSFGLLAEHVWDSYT